MPENVNPGIAVSVLVLYDPKGSSIDAMARAVAEGVDQSPEPPRC